MSGPIRAMNRAWGIDGSSDADALRKANEGNSRSPVIINNPAATSKGLASASSLGTLPSFLGNQKLGSSGTGKSLLGQ